MLTPELFTILPDYVCTPDGMAIDRAGRLILSCPNYADDHLSGCVVRIDRDLKVEKWFDVPVHPETGIARNMGIALDEEGRIYLCDNQGWSGKPELQEKGRVLCLTVTEAGVIEKCEVVADGMEHPNGIRIRNGAMYVTQSCLPRVPGPGGKLMSCVYRFALEERGVHITNTLDDANILSTFVTENPKCQYGVDGIVFDREGRLLIGNFGDGQVLRLTLSEDGTKEMGREIYAQDWSQLESTDGMIMDQAGNLYIADFSANAICRVSPDGRAERIAQSPDCRGADGGLDQPGEPILWNGVLIASCFDNVVGEGKVNLKHDMPAALVQLRIGGVEAL